MPIYLKTLLLIAGLAGLAIGISVLFMPHPFYASSGIDLGQNPSLLSEVRAPGGALLACGLLIILGAFVDTLTFTALVVSAWMYLAYGLSRGLSIWVDGMPAPILVAAMVAEFLIGLSAVFALANGLPRSYLQAQQLAK